MSGRDTVVIGAGTNGLVAAIALARAGSKVTVVESREDCGGVLREIEFAPGFRVSPMVSDLGWVPPEVARGVGIGAMGARAVETTLAAPAGDGRFLELKRDPSAAAAAIRPFSSRDAERWPEFVSWIHRLSGFLASLYLSPPPRIEADSIGELIAMLKLGRKLRGLGKVEMIDVLRVIPMSVAEVLDDWFESDLLKGAIAADAVTNSSQGPISGATAFGLLHRQVGLDQASVNGRSMPSGGSAWFIDQLVESARAAGVEFVTGKRVSEIVVEDDRVGGVRLDSGDRVEAKEVVSSLDPYRSLLELLDPIHLDPEFIEAVRHIRFRGSVTKVLVGLKGLPDLPSGAPPIAVAPSIRYLEQGYDAAKYGEVSPAPYVLTHVPSVARPELAPNGCHVAVLHVQYTPYRLREGSWPAIRERVGDLAVATVDQRIPGFASRVMARRVLTPVDLEAEFGCREGAICQGEMMLDQILFMRPVAGWARYAMPVPGLFLAGSGTHPGGGITGASGWLAAQAVLKGRRQNGNGRRP